MFGFQVFGIQMITVFIDRAVMYYVTKMCPTKSKTYILPQDKLKDKVFYITYSKNQGIAYIVVLNPRVRKNVTIHKMKYWEFEI